MKYLAILLVFLLNCNSEITKPKGTPKIEDKSLEPNLIYKRAIDLLKSEGYTKEIILKEENPENNIFSSNGKINSKGVKLVSSESDKTWVEVVLYSYETEENAGDVIKKIVNNKMLDIIFKNYNALYVQGNSILLLNSGCSNSYENWKEIRSLIKKKIGLEESLNCRCGGRCN